jgi:hypothetical protein
MSEPTPQIRGKIWTIEPAGLPKPRPALVVGWTEPLSAS